MPAIAIIFIILGVLSAANGAWMLVSAPTWYENLPGVVDTGAYNGHFVRDIGLAYFVSGAGFVWCAFNLRRCWPPPVCPLRTGLSTRPVYYCRGPCLG